MNPTDIDTHNNSTDKFYSVEMFDPESNELITFTYRNEKTFKDKFKEMNFREIDLREMNFRGMDWIDKEMIIRILDKKQKKEEYRRQKDEEYRRQKDEEYRRRNRYIFIKGRTQ